MSAIRCVGEHTDGLLSSAHRRVTNRNHLAPLAPLFILQVEAPVSGTWNTNSAGEDADQVSGPEGYSLVYVIVALTESNYLSVQLSSQLTCSCTYPT